MTPNFAITCGGMRGLKDLVDGCILQAKTHNTFQRFIQPDNSFGTWWNLIEKPVQNDSNRREIHTIAVKPENRLHLTEEDVHEFYRSVPAHSHECWYITPVGNPSGTKMTPTQLETTCKAIIANNPNAIILLDSVYVRTLSVHQASALIRGILEDPQVLGRTVFLDSFSKSHGLCRERLGCYFTTNAQLFAQLHAANIAYSAGPGVIKDYQFQAIGSSTEEEIAGVRDLHVFWQNERLGLYKYLLQDKFSHLFASSQSHLCSDDLDNSLGLYILLKTRPNIRAQDVFMETGTLGVDTPLLSGHYIRFSVGAFLEPTYAK
eukprot:TRINITY_DN908_c0_g1_i6.p1 TRINITY_DN908_c0_g1~~TRINITY_DN908_c0_g1_i6.p1  ORF type:complete len:319 (-),score=26.78 TRINITY_DN908_c0_g1_i6:39-995(-)